MRDTSKKLRRLGFAAVDNSTALTLAVLYNAGVFDRGAVLVGTHAYSALLNSLGAHVIPSPLTEDVDLAARIELATLPKFDLEEAVDEANRTLKQKARRGAMQALRLLRADHPEASGLLERLLFADC